MTLTHIVSVDLSGLSLVARLCERTILLEQSGNEEGMYVIGVSGTGLSRTQTSFYKV